MFLRSPFGQLDEGPHNRVVVVNSLRRSARLPFQFHFVDKDFVDMAWSAGSGLLRCLRTLGPGV